MISTNKILHFTIIEVVVAVTILATSLTALLTLSFTAQQRLARAAEKQQHFHMLQQAAEYYMLQPNKPDSVPDTIFDYPNFQPSCTIDESPGMVEELNDESALIQLDVWTIAVTDTRTNNVVESIQIDRLHYDED